MMSPTSRASIQHRAPAAAGSTACQADWSKVLRAVYSRSRASVLPCPAAGRAMVGTLCICWQLSDCWSACLHSLAGTQADFQLKRVGGAQPFCRPDSDCFRLQLTWPPGLHPSSTLTCREGMRPSEQYLVPSRHCCGHCPTSMLRSSSMDATEGDSSARKLQTSADRSNAASPYLHRLHSNLPESAMHDLQHT